MDLTSDLIRKFPEVKAPLEAMETVSCAFSEIPSEKNAFSVMGQVGDSKHIWDKNKPVEVEAAKAMFDTLTKKGYLAFHVQGKEGEKGEQMKEFDPKAERVIFVPAMQGG